MALRRPGDKPLYGPVMVSFLTYICVTRPQWVKHGTHVKAIYEVIHIHVHVIKCEYHQYMIHRSSMSCSWNAVRINIIQWFDDNDYAYIQLPVFNHSSFPLQRQYYQPLTYWLIFNIIKDPFTFHIISWNYSTGEDQIHNEASLIASEELMQMYCELDALINIDNFFFW